MAELLPLKFTLEIDDCELLEMLELELPTELDVEFKLEFDELELNALLETALELELTLETTIELALETIVGSGSEPPPPPPPQAVKIEKDKETIKSFTLC